jgi:hypothetical protein
MIETLPDTCIKHICRFLTPSEQDHIIDLTILSMDDFDMCVSCDIKVAAWNGHCYDCHVYRVCLECRTIPSLGTVGSLGKRYYQMAGVYKRVPNVCPSCYESGIPSFSCFFCNARFCALEGYRIVIESDARSYEQVICSKCIDTAFGVHRWKNQWVDISICPSTYGAKLWYGSALPLPDVINYKFASKPALLLFMQQSKSHTDLM